jgi:redox-sensing transcriptional repressor
VTPERTVGRLTQYRRILNELVTEGIECIHSHQLALRAGATAAQVRRDLMVIGAAGSPKKGYRCISLLQNLAAFLDPPSGQKVALVGLGNLGLALLSYFRGRRPGLEIVAAFDTDPEKVNAVANDCPCHQMTELDAVIQKEQIRVAILAVPASAAQHVGDRLSLAGIRGIVNFAPTALHLPPTVFVENIDVTMSLEKVAFFASKKT